LGVTHRSGPHEFLPKCVLGISNRPDDVGVPNPLELFVDALSKGDDH